MILVARAEVGQLKLINTYTRHPGEDRGWAYQLNQSPVPVFAGMTICLGSDL
jgi:hypothetical protein